MIEKKTYFRVKAITLIFSFMIFWLKMSLKLFFEPNLSIYSESVFIWVKNYLLCREVFFELKSILLSRKVKKEIIIKTCFLRQFLSRKIKIIIKNAKKSWEKIEIFDKIFRQRGL